MNSSNTRTNQGGSVISFVVVGMILVVVVIGGLTLLQSRSDKTAQVNPSASSSPSPSAGTSGSSQSPQTSSSNSPLPSTSQSPATSPKPTTSPKASTSPSTGNTGKGSSDTTIPQTGPTDILLPGFAAAILSGIIIAYIQSRRALA